MGGSINPVVDMAATLKWNHLQPWSGITCNLGLESAATLTGIHNSRQIKRMIAMYDEGKNTVGEICKIYDISRPSFYNYLKRKKIREAAAAQ